MAAGDPVVGNLTDGASFTPAAGVVVLITQYGSASVGGGLCAATTVNFYVINPGGSNFFNGRIGIFVSNSNPVTQRTGNGSYSGIQTA
jgi:hypothetical protein